MSSRLKRLVTRYSAALLPSVGLDYSVYFSMMFLFGEKFPAFVVGRLVGFLTFYTVAAHQTRSLRFKHFLVFLMLFVANILATWILETMDILAADHLFYKLTMDAILFLFNFLFFRFVQFGES